MGVCSYCHKYQREHEECFGWEEATSFCGVERPKISPIDRNRTETPMTNNMKAERTLTAEELQTIIDGCEKATPGPWFEGDKWVFVSPRSGEPTHALENIFRDVPEAQENCLHVSRLDPETVKAMALELQHLRSQSLSTQQPMGEVTWERMARAQSRKLQAVLHVPGVKDVLHELDWENGDPLEGWDFVRLSALHPNQESGE